MIPKSQKTCLLIFFNLKLTQCGCPFCEKTMGRLGYHEMIIYLLVVYCNYKMTPCLNQWKKDNQPDQPGETPRYI